MNNRFCGCSEEMYRFFWEIAFQNNRDFFEANRKRYEKNVRLPMYALAGDLLPAALDINPEFDPRPSVIVSRIHRDTRYLRDKSPYRDHVWLGFRPAGISTGEALVIYAEFERTHYGYGMGMYRPVPALMEQIRARIIARPDAFLTLIHDEAFCAVFKAERVPYSRKKFSHADAEIETWLNSKSIGFYFDSPEIAKTFPAEFEEELKEALRLLKPLYRFLMGLD